jgi:hypothetical protein
VPLLDNGRGSRVQIEVPHTKWAELEEARGVYDSLLKERKVTTQRRGALIKDRDSAIERDRVALAKAIKDGGADPGDKHVEKIEKEIAACTRRLEALEIALDDAEAELIDVVDTNRDSWAEQVEETMGAAYEEYAKVVESLIEKRTAISRSWALARWVRFFPDGELSYRPRFSLVAALQAPHGDPYTFDQVLDALRTDAQKPESIEPRVIPWGAAYAEVTNARNAS